MYNNVIVVPLLLKIADCAQQDRVLDLTRLFPSLAVGKGSGPRDYCTEFTVLRMASQIMSLKNNALSHTTFLYSLLVSHRSYLPFPLVTN